MKISAIVNDVVQYNQQLFYTLHTILEKRAKAKEISYLIDYILSIKIILPIYILTLSIFLIFLYKNRINILKYQKHFYKVLDIGFLLGFFIVFFYPLKFFIYSPRPYVSFEAKQMPFKKGIIFDAFSSFPSGHVGLTLLFIIYLFRKKCLYIFFSTIIFFYVASSRIVIAAHYPLDILGSIVISFLCYFCYNIFLMKYSLKTVIYNKIIHIIKKL